MSKTPVVVSWSGGKDSALMLARLLDSQEYEPVMLLTTLTEPFQRISMHGVRRELLHAQAEALGLPVQEVWIPWPCPNETYSARMKDALQDLKARGLLTYAFGDLFLDDIRQYRNANMEKAELSAIYPLWGEDTAALARRFLAEGYKATLCCVDSKQVPATLAGREYDEQLISELPASADPCGENGEFHTFVHDGPIFKHPVACETREGIVWEQFIFADIVPKEFHAA